jgi:hypothetical protein
MAVRWNYTNHKALVAGWIVGTKLFALGGRSHKWWNGRELRDNVSNDYTRLE